MKIYEAKQNMCVRIFLVQKAGWPASKAYNLNAISEPTV
jgi:hypothetical protein